MKSPQKNKSNQSKFNQNRPSQSRPSQNKSNQNRANQGRVATKFPKDKPLEAAPKNEVKEMFFQWFRKRNIVGQIMSKQDVVSSVIAKLDAKQNDALEKAMDELINNGFLDVQEDGVTLVLTQRGSEFIKD